MRSFAPLILPLRPSRKLRVALLIAHLFAAGAVALSQVPPWLAAALVVAVLLSLARQWRIELPHTLILREKGRFEKVGADGTAIEVEVHPQTLVTVPLVILRHREQGKIRTLVLPQDSLSPDDARKLRVWLRWQATGLQPI